MRVFECEGFESCVVRLYSYSNRTWVSELFFCTVLWTTDPSEVNKLITVIVNKTPLRRVHVVCCAATRMLPGDSCGRERSRPTIARQSNRLACTIVDWVSCLLYSLLIPQCFQASTLLPFNNDIHSRDPQMSANFRYEVEYSTVPRLTFFSTTGGCSAAGSGVWWSR